MSNMHISGLGSGIDWRSMVDAIMDVERLPMSRWAQRQQSLRTVKEAWMSLKTSLATVDKRLQTLGDPATFATKSVSSSNRQVVSASASSAAGIGSHQLSVIRMAQAHTIASDSHGEGPLGLSGAFNVNGEVVTIDSLDSLEDVADRIGQASPGVSASVIDGRLVLKALDTGVANSINLTDPDGILQAIGVLETNDPNSVKHELLVAENSLFSLDGLIIERSSNRVSDVLTGVTLVLAGEGAATVTTAVDHSHAIQAVKGFVEAYNAFVTKAARDRGRNGILEGDPVLSRIDSGLRTIATTPLEAGAGPYNALLQIGIGTTSTSPTLHVDEAALREALEASAEGVRILFSDGSEGKNGIADLLRARIAQFIDDYDGAIALRENRLDSEISDLQRRMDALETRLERREEHLVKRFIAMEAALNQLQSQSNWLNMWSLSMTIRQPGRP